MASNEPGTEGAVLPDHVVRLFREQAELYANLEGFSIRQRTLITGGDSGALLSLLSDRRALSDRLTAIARRLGPVRRNWPAIRANLVPAQRAAIDELLTGTERCLARVTARDSEDARLLSARKAAVAGALRATHTTSEAISAYRVPRVRSQGVDYAKEAR